MKLKVISALLLSVLSFNTFSMQGHGFRIVSEKLTQSPGFRGGFKESPSKETFSPMYASAFTMTYDAEGKVNEHINIKSDHEVNISNYTSQTQRYIYKYTLLCENVYETFERTIDIEPHGNFSDNSHAYGDAQLDREGYYRIRAATEISGSESAFHESSAILRIRD